MIPRDRIHGNMIRTQLSCTIHVEVPRQHSTKELQEYNMTSASNAPGASFGV
jgi:hypothetical protein